LIGVATVNIHSLLQQRMMVSDYFDIEQNSMRSSIS